MIFPAITAFYASILALIFVALSVWVVFSRVATDTLHGGGDETLLKRIRTHGNFAEYVPFAVLLIGLLEASGAAGTVVRALLVVLLIARLAQPIGMFAPKNSPRQFACRGGAIIATLAVIAIAAILLLLRVA